jgi:hypothetical protein
MPDDLVVQQDWLRKVVRAHGIPIFEVPGYEADDVIGTLSRQASKKGWEVLIVSGDKDMMQLVDERVKMYNVFKPDQQLVIEGFEAVKEKFGTTPEHVIDVLAIMGDSSDNVPGVSGIGEKGAIKLIEEFGSVPNLLEHLEQVKGKAREHIARDRELLLLSLDLVTIRDDVPLDPGLDALAPPEPELHALVALLRELGFQSLLKKVRSRSQDEQRDRTVGTARSSRDDQHADEGGHLRSTADDTSSSRSDGVTPASRARRTCLVRASNADRPCCPEVRRLEALKPRDEPEVPALRRNTVRLARADRRRVRLRATLRPESHSASPRRAATTSTTWRSPTST